MSGLFGNDEDRAAEKLIRAGASNRTILAALPTDRDGGIDPPPRPPARVVRDRFPEPHQEMFSIDAYDLGKERLKGAFERQKKEREEREEQLRGMGIEQLKRELRRRGIQGI
jgi:hypothetical protein